MLCESKKLGASFKLVDDPTQAQLETWERETREAIQAVKDPTPAVGTRACVTGAIKAGMIVNVEKCPETVEAVAESGARVLAWMSDTISAYIKDVKTVSPN